jgi:proteic killer suppression protein
VSLPCRSACRVAEAARSRSALGLLFAFLVIVDKRQLPLYCLNMIRRFGHRGLRRLYENDDRRGVSSELVEKTARVLARLDVATRPEQLNLPSFRLHRLEGDLAGYWSVTVEGEWKIIFGFDVENTTDVDLVEYH